ncbi:calmodulin-binding protein 25-like [Curcuma longa]|uniref:calmodulin-binding protein 25-like n=1 Tax=Curcuma longa TaxID=136217 RepID=UPI003D9F97B1
MENFSSMDPWTHRPSAFAGGGGGGDSAGLLSESSSAVSTAAVPSPESLSSYPPPRGDSRAGRVARKRKSRASKRSSTTYIASSPAHFRELVQRVTGNRSADEVDPPATEEVGSRVFSPLDAASAAAVFDPAGFFWPGGRGLVPDPAVAEFDPLLLAASGFPTLDSWHMI